MTLFGRGGQTDVAEALGVEDRTLRRWLAGERRLPEDLAARLETIASERITEISAFRAQLRRAAQEE